jgi:hypothetical protein
MIKGPFLIVDGDDIRVVFDHIDGDDNGITTDLTSNTFTVDLYSTALGKWFGHSSGAWDQSSAPGDCDFVMVGSADFPGKFEYVATDAAKLLRGNVGTIDFNIISSSQASSDDNFDFPGTENPFSFELEKAMTSGGGKLENLDADMETLKNESAINRADIKSIKTKVST